MAEYPQRRCFISHTWAGHQHKFARYLCQRLRRFQGIDVWLDEAELVAGDHIYDRIGEALEKSCDLTICVLSPEYLSSDNCKAELSKAARLYREKKHRLIPVLLADCSLPLEVEGLLHVDFTAACTGFGDIVLSEFNQVLPRLVQAIRYREPVAISSVLLVSGCQKSPGCQEGALEPMASPRVGGAYLAVGRNPNGTEYKGQVEIIRRGDRYQIGWRIGKDQFRAGGVLRGHELQLNPPAA